MSWSSIHLEVTTPLFNAGHDPDRHDQDGPDATGVRVPSMLGAMRFWFRAMAGAHVGNDLAALHYWEGRVFGRAGDENAGDDAASPIQWRIPTQPKVTPAGSKPDGWLPSYCKRSARDQGDDRWIVYLLGQSLGNLRDCTLNRSYVPPGQSFELKFRPRRDDPAALGLALGSLWLTCAFGGVGARTRRGFGGLRITGFEPNGLTVPSPWDHLALDAPTGPLYPRLTRLAPEQFGRCLPLFHLPPPPPGRQGPSAGNAHEARLREFGRHRRQDRVFRWDAPAPYPVLGGSAAVSGTVTTTAGLGSATYSSWNHALQDAGRRWRLLRASEDTPGVPYYPKVKTPEWTEVIHGGDDQFSLGALGLPVVYKEGWSVNAVADGEQLRRASPVWIRPVQVDGRWRLFSYAFLDQVLPDNATPPVQVHVLKGGARTKTVTVPQDDLEFMATAWLREIGATPGGT